MTGAERMARARARMRRLVDELFAENERLRKLLRGIRSGTVPLAAVDEELRREHGWEAEGTAGKRLPNSTGDPQSG